MRDAASLLAVAALLRAAGAVYPVVARVNPHFQVLAEEQGPDPRPQAPTSRQESVRADPMCLASVHADTDIVRVAATTSCTMRRKMRRLAMPKRKRTS